jgi:uncharacterized protein
MQRLIYLHGFRSSAQSRKARELGEALVHVSGDWEYVTPNLSHDPAIAMAQITAILDFAPGLIEQTTLIGSSLGGFYATHFANQTGCRAVLLNPSIAPHETLKAHVGPQTNLYTGEAFTFEATHIETLAKHQLRNPHHPAQLMLIVEMGDVLLDHEKTVAFCTGANVIRVEGGDHDLASFPQHIPKILSFAGLPGLQPI